MNRLSQVAQQQTYTLLDSKWKIILSWRGSLYIWLWSIECSDFDILEACSLSGTSLWYTRSSRMCAYAWVCLCILKSSHMLRESLEFTMLASC